MSVLMLKAEVVVEESVGKELAGNIEEMYHARGIKSSFHIEQLYDKFLLISTEEGMMRKVPLENISAEDILNIMETMEEEIFIIRASKKDKEKKAVPEKVTPIRKIEERGVFKVWPENISDRKFRIGLTISREERGAGGMEFSAGFHAFRFGMGFTKGLNISFDNIEVNWDAFSFSGRLTLMRLFELHLTAGAEFLVYNMNTSIFDKEFITTSLYYQTKYFVPELRLKYAPGEVALVSDNERYVTDRVVVVFLLSFVF